MTSVPRILGYKSPSTDTNANSQNLSKPLKLSSEDFIGDRRIELKIRVSIMTGETKSSTLHSRRR